jgi:hypothetical protein
MSDLPECEAEDAIYWDEVVVSCARPQRLAVRPSQFRLDPVELGGELGMELRMQRIVVRRLLVWELLDAQLFEPSGSPVNQFTRKTRWRHHRESHLAV